MISFPKITVFLILFSLICFIISVEILSTIVAIKIIIFLQYSFNSFGEIIFLLSFVFPHKLELLSQKKQNIIFFYIIS